MLTVRLARNAVGLLTVDSVLSQNQKVLQLLKSLWAAIVLFVTEMILVPTKIGQCIAARYNGVPNGCLAPDRISPSCNQDADCLGLKKCCSDACGQKRCLYPAVTTCK